MLPGQVAQTQKTGAWHDTTAVKKRHGERKTEGTMVAHELHYPLLLAHGFLHQ